MHELSPREVKDLGTLRVAAGGRLSFRFTDRAGHPIAGLSAQVFDRAGDHVALLVAKDGTGTQRLPAGEYEVEVFNERFVPKREPFSIRAKEETKLELTLDAGAMRELRFSLSATPELGASATCVVTRPDGSKHQSTIDDLTPGEPLSIQHWFVLGEHQVAITTANRQRFAGSFTITSVEPSREPLRVPVSAVK